MARGRTPEDKRNTLGNTPYQKAKKSTKKRRLESIFLKSFLAVFICAVIGGVAIQAKKYENIQEERALVMAQIEEEEARRADFENQKEYYNSDAYIEQLAREQLGMIKSNEILYINRGE